MPSTDGADAINEMERGLYIAATGMLSSIVRQDVIASNLANVNTVGYKGDRVVNESFSDTLLYYMKYGGQNLGSLSMGTRVAGVVTDFTPGNLRPTENPLDMAIGGDGFFMVAGRDGKTYFTRNGQFQKNAEGYLVTTRGEFVLGADQRPLFIGEGDPTVMPDGRIFASGSTLVGQIGIAQLDTDDAIKIGDNLWDVPQDRDGDGQTVVLGYPQGTEIRQRFVEASSVKSIEQMVDMISTLRTYESSQRVISAIDGTLDKAVNSVGALG
jgi:flagellar basal-body rod protein FlgF